MKNIICISKLKLTIVATLLNPIILFSQAITDSSAKVIVPQINLPSQAPIYSNTIDPLGTINTILVAASIIIAILGIIFTVLLIIINKKSDKVENKINDLETSSAKVKSQLESLNKMESDINLLKDKYQKENALMINSMDIKIKTLDKEITEMIYSISKINSKTLLIDEFIKAKQFNTAKNVIREIYKGESLFKENKEFLLNLKLYKCRIYIENEQDQNIDKALRLLNEAKIEFGECSEILDKIGWCYFIKCNECQDQNLATSFILKALESFKKILIIEKLNIPVIQKAKLNISEGHIMINQFKDSLDIIHEIELDDHKETDLDKHLMLTIKLIIFCKDPSLDLKNELFEAFEKNDFKIKIEYALKNYRHLTVLLLELQSAFEKFKNK